MPGSQIIQPAQQGQVTPREQQLPRGQPTSFIVVDNQQSRPSRPLTFTLTLMKHFNPPSIASSTGEESSHNISGCSIFFWNLQSVMSYCQITTSQSFSPSAPHQLPLLQPPPCSKNSSSHPSQIQS